MTGKLTDVRARHMVRARHVSVSCDACSGRVGFNFSHPSGEHECFLGNLGMAVSGLNTIRLFHSVFVSALFRCVLASL